MRHYELQIIFFFQKKKFLQTNKEIQCFVVFFFHSHELFFKENKKKNIQQCEDELLIDLSIGQEANDNDDGDDEKDDKHDKMVQSAS